MNNSELLRGIDAISRDRNIDKDLLFEDLEQAMVSAARKHFNADEEEPFSAEIDRLTGKISVFRDQEEIPLEELGRIPAQTAKQVMIQRFREDERASIFEEFIDRVGDLITGTAQRYEGNALVVSLGRSGGAQAEGFMPRSEQIPGEQHQPGERVRCMILDVRDTGSQVKIVLSRASPDVIKRLFEIEVPEVNERIIEVKAMAREAGHRTKIAVASIDSKVDAVGACVGVRGSRIKNIVDELGGEKIDIVRWNESSQLLIQNSLKPAEVVEISLCFELGRATVVVHEDQLSLAIGKRGQNVRLAARLTNWDVDILTPAEFTKSLDTMDTTLSQLEGVNETHIDRLGALGIISVFDVEEVGVEYLAEQLEVDTDLAQAMVKVASEKGKIVAVEQAKEKEASEKKRKARQEAIAAGLDPDAIDGGGDGASPEADAQAAAILGGGMPPVASPSAQNVEGTGEALDDATDAAEDASATGTDEQDQAQTADDSASVVDVLQARQEGVPVTDVPAADGADVPEQPIDLDDPQAGVTGTDADRVEMTEAIQQGGAAEMLADATPPEAGTVASSVGQMDEPADGSRASSPTEPGTPDVPTEAENQAEQPAG
jgi:N utilization substance protein A